MIIIGIDPGKNGGIARICEGKAKAFKMPETPRDIYRLLSDLGECFPDCFAYLELAHAFPAKGINNDDDGKFKRKGQGVVGLAKFMKHNGHLEMALIGVGIPFEQVTPAKWQGAMSCRTKGDKNITKRKAQELFPELKITHAIADALLIAEYGRRLRHERDRNCISNC